MAHLNFVESNLCMNHGGGKSERFYLKTGIRDVRTKGQTYFICGANGCKVNKKLDEFPLYECPKHVGKNIELQLVERGKRISVRCPENKTGWCSEYLNMKQENVNLKVLKPLSDITNVDRQSTTNEEKRKPMPLHFTSTPKITPAIVDEMQIQRKKRAETLLWRNFEASSDCSSLEQNEADVANDVSIPTLQVNTETFDRKKAESKKSLVEESDVSKDEDSLEMSVSGPKNVSEKVIQSKNESELAFGTKYEPTYESIVVDNSSEGVQLVADSISKSSIIDSPIAPSVRPKFNRLRFDDSSKDSFEFDPNSDRSRSILLTNKEKMKPLNASQPKDSFSQIRENKIRLDSSDSEQSEDDDDADEDESHGVVDAYEKESHIDVEPARDVESNNVPAMIVNSVSSDDDDVVQVEDDTNDVVVLEDDDADDDVVQIDNSSDGSFEIPPIESNRNQNQFVDLAVTSDESSVEISHPSPTSAESEALFKRLELLMAAKKKARFLPDGGARLDAKIAEVRQEILTFENSRAPIAARASETKTFGQNPNLAIDMQMKNLYATNDDQRQKLYGGRMNLARKMEVRVVTNDAIEELHSAVTNIPPSTEETDDPRGLATPLMIHQRQALTWLKWRENKRPPGGILADDMGLGKTLTMISLVLLNRTPKRDDADWRSKKLLGDCKLVPSNATLVICPASLIFQWEKEIETRVKPGYLTTLVYHGPRREISAERISSYDIVITTYATVASEVGDDEENPKKKENARKKKIGTSVLLKIGWERIILDEAHVIKNPRSLTCRACCRLPAGKRWVLTGTPVHNCLKDLFSLLKFLRCEPFDEWEVWKRWIENKSDKAKDRLNTIVKGVLLRRTKEQMCSVTGRALVPLPAKKFETHELELFPLERKVYDRLFEASKKQVAEFVRMQEERDDQLVAVSRGYASHQQFGYKNPFLSRKFQSSNDDNGRSSFTQSHILVLLLRLRQACTHLALMKEAVDIDAFDDENAEENLVQQMNDMTLFEQKEIVATVESKVDGLFEREYLSTKIKMVLDQIDAISAIRDNEDMQKMVVVSQWAKLLEIIMVHLRRRGIPFTWIDGQVKLDERNVRVEKFNAKNRGPIVMLLSLTAGGVGLNLAGGNHLFLVDMHWNPALEQQACDRIYRMGQTKNVFIHKFLCKNSIEEKVFELQNKKKQLANAVMTGAKAVGALSKDDLKYLFGLDDLIAGRRNERK